MKTKRFSDFNIKDERKMLSVKATKIADIIGKEILISDYVVFDSIKEVGKKCLKIRFNILNDNEVRTLSTGSTVLMRQIQHKEIEFPFVCKILKEKNYYMFE